MTHPGGNRLESRQRPAALYLQKSWGVGVFLARVLLPAKVERYLLLVRDGALYGVMRDSLDVPYVVKLRPGLMA